MSTALGVGVRSIRPPLRVIELHVRGGRTQQRPRGVPVAVGDVLHRPAVLLPAVSRPRSLPGGLAGALRRHGARQLAERADVTVTSNDRLACRRRARRSAGATPPTVAPATCRVAIASRTRADSYASRTAARVRARRPLSPLGGRLRTLEAWARHRSATPRDETNDWRPSPSLNLIDGRRLSDRCVMTSSAASSGSRARGKKLAFTAPTELPSTPGICSCGIS